MAKTSDSTSNSSSSGSTRGTTRKRKGQRRGSANGGSGASSSSSGNGSSSGGSRDSSSDGRGGQGSRSAKSLDVFEVFRREVAEIRDGEEQLTRFLPKLEQSARARDLQDCLERLQGESERFQRSLGRVAKEHEGDEKQRCNAMRGLITEAKKGLRALEASPERDILTIANVQKMLHYTIASYGSLRAWSQLVGDEDAQILFENLVSARKRLDRSLTEIAEDSLYSGAGAR